MTQAPLVSHPKRLALLVTLPVLGFYLWLTVSLWNQFKVNTTDLTIFIQELSTLGSSGAPLSTFRGGDGFNRLGDHFSLLNFLNLPIYQLFPSGLTLSIVQASLLAVSCFVVTRAAILKLHHPWGVIVGLLYGLSYGLISTVASSFHEVAFAVPLLALAGAAYLEKRYAQALLWSLPLVFVKEDMGITVAMIAGVLFLITKNWRFLLGAVWGVFWTAFAIFLFIPHFNIGAGYDQAYIFEDFKNLEWASVKTTLLCSLALLTGGLALRSPWALLALPTVAWRLLADQGRIAHSGFWYEATLMPILFIAAIDGYLLLGKGKLERARKGLAILAVLVSVTLSVTTYGPKDALAGDPTRIAEYQKTLAMVPDAAVVDTDAPWSDRLAPTHEVYCSYHCYQFQYEKKMPAPDYVIYNSTQADQADWLAKAKERWPSLTYKLIYENSYGDWVLQKE